jgi:hypothetical protein
MKLFTKAIALSLMIALGLNASAQGLKQCGAHHATNELIDSIQKPIVKPRTSTRKKTTRNISFRLFSISFTIMAKKTFQMRKLEMLLEL